jgi:hypothetical protein
MKFVCIKKEIKRRTTSTKINTVKTGQKKRLLILSNIGNWVDEIGVPINQLIV